MLYAVTYEIEAVWGPGGFVATTREDVVGVAKSIAEIALDQLDDAVNAIDWFDLEGNDADARVLLQSEHIEELVNVISQISEEIMIDESGYICLWEYSDLFELVDGHNVKSWCTESLKMEITRVRKEYFSLVDKISDEWG